MSGRLLVSYGTVGTLPREQARTGKSTHNVHLLQEPIGLDPIDARRRMVVLHLRSCWLDTKSTLSMRPLAAFASQRVAQPEQSGEAESGRF